MQQPNDSLYLEQRITATTNYPYQNLSISLQSTYIHIML